MTIYNLEHVPQLVDQRQRLEQENFGLLKVNSNMLYLDKFFEFILLAKCLIKRLTELLRDKRAKGKSKQIKG